MWETMGPIAQRNDEILGASDLAVVEFRRQMVEAAQLYQSTGNVIGVYDDQVPQSKLHSFEGVVPKSSDWRNLGCSPEEMAWKEKHEPQSTAAE